jgi:hypothetical protein
MAVNSEKTLDFQPIEYDDHTLPPDAPADEWSGSTINDVKVKATQKDKFPMLVIEVALGTPDDDDHADYTGTRKTEFLTFFPKRHNAYRMGNLRMHQIAAALGLDIDVFPTKITEAADFAECIEALKGADPFTVWTIHETRKDTGEEVAALRWTKPGSSLTMPAADEDDVKPAKAGAAKNGSAKKNGAKGTVKNGRRVN